MLMFRRYNVDMFITVELRLMEMSLVLQVFGHPVVECIARMANNKNKNPVL